MLAIRVEIRHIEMDQISRTDNPLTNAPHTMTDLAEADWKRPYSRAKGGFPTGVFADKYWSPVNRINNAYGDRNLMCTCAPVLSEHEEEPR
jgi:glycine dehydrogenase